MYSSQTLLSVAYWSSLLLQAAERVWQDLRQRIVPRSVHFRFMLLSTPEPPHAADLQLLTTCAVSVCARRGDRAGILALIHELRALSDRTVTAAVRVVRVAHFLPSP